MTDARDIAAAAEKIKKELINHRRHIHGEAEVGFDLERTVGYVKKILDSAGIEYTDCGRCGITAVIGDKKKNAFLLRADMDALAIKEESGEAFAADNGNMHACGHDMHTAILLGVSKLLKGLEPHLPHPVKLLFQPAEERCIFEYQGVKILLLVCYDLRFPVWARNQSGSDYDIILVVANWPDIRIQYWDALIAARATENQCYIAAVNCVGDVGMCLHYIGHSVAYDTRLQPIVSFADDEEGTKIADFDIAKLHHFREVLPLWKDVDHFELKK